jgi:hypothetical protein
MPSHALIFTFFFANNLQVESHCRTPLINTPDTPCGTSCVSLGGARLYHFFFKQDFCFVKIFVFCILSCWCSILNRSYEFNEALVKLNDLHERLVTRLIRLCRYFQWYHDDEDAPLQLPKPYVRKAPNVALLRKRCRNGVSGERDVVPGRGKRHMGCSPLFSVRVRLSLAATKHRQRIFASSSLSQLSGR